MLFIEVIANMMLLTLPGTSFSYYGEEIGMTNVDVSFEQTVDYRAKQAGEVSDVTDSCGCLCEMQNNGFTGFCFLWMKTHQLFSFMLQIMICCVDNCCCY